MPRQPVPGAYRPGGIVVGAWRDGRRTRWLYDTSDRHVFAFAPSGSGKTTCLVIPTLLSWPHSVIALDIKSELWRLTSGYRERVLGNVCLRFDPTSTDGTAARYNPLFGIPRGSRDVAEAQGLADILIDLDSGHGPNQFFRQAAHGHLVGTMLHTLYAEREKTLAACADLLSHPARDLSDTARRMLSTHHDPDLRLGWRFDGRPTPTHPAVRQASATWLRMDERTAGSVFAEMQNPLNLLRDPDAARSTEMSDFTAEDLVASDRPVSLYLTVAPNELVRLRDLLRLVLSQVMRHLTGAPSGQRRRPLLLLLDEFTTLGRLDFLHQAVAYLRGFGVRVFISIQTLAQLHERYGQYQSISANCGTQIAYGANDAETAKLLSEMSGVTTVEFDQRSVSGGGFAGRATDSRGHIQRPLLTPDEVRRLPADRSIVFVAGLQPILGTRLPYFRDPDLAARASLPPAEGRRDALGARGSSWDEWPAYIPPDPVHEGVAKPKRAAGGRAALFPEPEELREPGPRDSLSR